MDELIRRWQFSAETNEWVCRIPPDLFPELIRRIKDPRPPDPIQVLVRSPAPRPTGVVLERDAVKGLAGLLGECDRLLRKLASAYKGSQTCHAPGLARQCEKTVELLRVILEVEDGNSER